MSALRNSGVQDEVVFELPVPVLIQIDRDSNVADRIPAKIKLSGRDDSLPFDITVIKLWTYDVKALIDNGFHLLLPFLLVKYRKGKKTEKKKKALISDLHEIEAAISELYDSGQIRSYLRLNLHETLNSIVHVLNAKYYNNNPEIDEELNKMKTKRAVFAQELVAEGEARGVDKGVDKGIDISAEIIVALANGEPIERIAERLQVSIGKIEQLQSAMRQ